MFRVSCRACKTLHSMAGTTGRIPDFMTPQGTKDLEKFGLNERYMDEWLRLQAEKTEGSMVRTRLAMTLSPSLYFASRRCTTSDVMSIVTTSRAVSSRKKSPLGGDKKASKR